MEAIFPKIALKIAISVFFRGLKSKSGYFLAFSKKISDVHTYHFYIKSAPPPPGLFLGCCYVVVSEPKVAAKKVKPGCPFSIAA